MERDHRIDLDAVPHVAPVLGWHDQTWVNEPLGDDWVVSYRVAEQDGELVVTEIRIHAAPHTLKEGFWFQASLVQQPGGDDGTKPATPAGGLRTRRVRAAVRTAAAVEQARDSARRMRPMGDYLGFPERFSREAIDTPRRVGRRGRSDHWYAQVAAVYVEAVENGRRDANVAVAEQLRTRRGGHYDTVFARDAINRARARGLLTKPPKGRAGGQLTDKAIAILNPEGTSS